MLPSEYIEKGLCKYFSALTKDGRVTNPGYPNATQWSMTGAVGAFTQAYLDELQRVLGKDIEGWNNTYDRTLGEVLDVMKEVEENLGLRARET